MQDRNYKDWARAAAESKEVPGLASDSVKHAWWKKLLPVVEAAADSQGDNHRAFNSRLCFVDSMLDELHYGLGEPSTAPVTEQGAPAVKKPKYWWQHQNLYRELDPSASGVKANVEVNEDSITTSAQDYLANKWLRHPLLDWFFLEVLLFSALRNEIRGFRRCLALRSFRAGSRFDFLRFDASLPELRQSEFLGRMMGHLRTIATALLLGVVLPLTWLVIAPLKAVDWAHNATGVVAVGVAGLVGLVLAMILLRLIFLFCLSFFFGVDNFPMTKDAALDKIQNGLRQAIEGYELLRQPVIPVSILSARLAEGESAAGIKVPVEVWALIERIRESDGAVLVPGGGREFSGH